MILTGYIFLSCQIGDWILSQWRGGNFPFFSCLYQLDSLVFAKKTDTLELHVSVSAPFNFQLNGLRRQGKGAAGLHRSRAAMSETGAAAPAPSASAEQKPRRLQGHKKGSVTCCIASSARPGVVASSGEVPASTRSGLSPSQGCAVSWHPLRSLDSLLFPS
jgi:hypothetical protein